MTSNQFTSLESAISAPATIIAPASPLSLKPHSNSPVIASKIFKKNQLANGLLSLSSTTASSSSAATSPTALICSKDEHDSFKENLRHDQLSRIVKTLLYFESRLKNDQKNIRQMLYEKDKIINQQLNEILCIKKKYNDTSELSTSLLTDDVAQYCPKCRKNYYMIDTCDMSMQTNEDGFLFRERKSKFLFLLIFIKSYFFFSCQNS